MSCIADYLGLSGNYAAARLPQQQIAEARTQSLGAEHPGTLSARATSPTGRTWRGMRPRPTDALLWC
jgi:hypothetical protein